jgi:hypothetical protein
LDKNHNTSDPRPVDDAATTYNADIIAIHGLGGTAFKTWTHGNGRLWLRDFAPNEFPGARVYTYGYDSGFAFSKGTGTLRDFAITLLLHINIARDDIHEVQTIQTPI